MVKRGVTICLAKHSNALVLFRDLRYDGVTKMHVQHFGIGSYPMEKCRQCV